MSFLIDSDVVINSFAAQADAIDILPGLRRGGIAISAVPYMEIAKGSPAASRHDRGSKPYGGSCGAPESS